MMRAPAGDARDRMDRAPRRDQINIWQCFRIGPKPLLEVPRRETAKRLRQQDTSGLQQSVRFMLLAASLTDMMDHGFTV